MLNTSQNTMQTKTTLITDGTEPISELTTTRRPSNRDTVLKGLNALSVRMAFMAGKSAMPTNWAIIPKTESFEYEIKFNFTI